MFDLVSEDMNSMEVRAASPVQGPPAPRQGVVTIIRLICAHRRDISLEVAMTREESRRLRGVLEELENAHA